LLLRQGKVVSKEQIMTALCNWDNDLGENAIEVYIHRLRKKLEHSGVRIRTIRGLGYLLEKEQAAHES
jgi:two-component system OmpR family response regulator